MKEFNENELLDINGGLAITTGAIIIGGIFIAGVGVGTYLGYNS